jgi:glycosyltransferase involved in cell wall biosynthesis
LVVGRLIPDNNADIIVKGFLRANTKRKLVIVGDVPYKDSYVDYIRSYSSDSIIFTGYIRDPDELYDLYTNSFAYFHGHEFGGTNPTLLKALAYGCAVLALDTPFSREVLEGQKYGLYFLKEVESVSKSVHYAESNPDVMDKLKRKSRDRIVENYTWEKIANQYTELFLNL